MKVLSYKYLKPNSDGIVECLDRKDYMTPQYIDTVREYIETIKLTKPTAVLYAGGATLPSSESRVTSKKKNYREDIAESGLVIRELSAYCMHKWIGVLDGKENIKYANINANTCASSMHSLYEAEQLLNSGRVDEVVIIAEERTSYNTLRVFDEMNIDLKVGEGLAIIHLSKDGDDITDCKWGYSYDRNPFGVNKAGYTQVWNECDIVNPHGTGTDNNEKAEQSLIQDKPQLRYKEELGHTQGVSGLLEVCMVLDEYIEGKVLCVSSGLGGFYGSCIISK